VGYNSSPQRLLRLWQRLAVEAPPEAIT